MSFGKERFLPVNPFSDEYWKAELEAYGLRESRFHVEHVSVDWFKIHRDCPPRDLLLAGRRVMTDFPM